MLQVLRVIYAFWFLVATLGIVRLLVVDGPSRYAPGRWTWMAFVLGALAAYLLGFTIATPVGSPLHPLRLGLHRAAVCGDVVADTAGRSPQPLLARVLGLPTLVFRAAQDAETFSGDGVPVF